MNITNHTESNLDEFIEVVKRFLPFAQEQIGFNRPPTIDLISDSQNAQSMLGKTAFYDPMEVKVVVYTDGRHPKDMLRSISHELVHHAQNCNGEFDNSRPLGEDYAQTDPHLRSMEEDANLRGNMCVRDFVDQKLHLEESKRRNKTMVNEEQLREAIRKIIIEEGTDKDVPTSSKPGFADARGEMADFHRDDDEGDEDYSIGAEEAEEMTPEELAHRMRTLIDAFVEKMGVETAPPGMTEKGIELAQTTDWTRGRKSKEEKAAEAAAAGDAEEEVDIEAVVGETVDISLRDLHGILKEGRRRRHRRALRHANQKASKEAAVAQVAPVPPKAPEAEPDARVLGSKRVEATPSAPEKKPLKEWYGGELFDRLLKEAVK